MRRRGVQLGADDERRPGRGDRFGRRLLAGRLCQQHEDEHPHGTYPVNPSWGCVKSCAARRRPHSMVGSSAVNPQIRSNWSKQALRQAKRLSGPGRDVLLKAIGDDTIKVIREAGILGWLPAELHGRIFNAAHTVLGSKGAQTFWGELMFRNLDLALLRPLVEGGLSLF